MRTSSAPPLAADGRPAPRVSVPAASGTEGVCFALTHTHIGQGQSRVEADRTVLTAHVEARVVDDDGARLALSTGAALRYMVPDGVSLRALVGHTLRFEVSHELGADADVSVEVVVRDTAGRLVLWARDGRLPGGPAPDDLPVRVELGEGAPRLALCAGGRIVLLAGGEGARFVHRGEAYRLLVLRVERGAAAFLTSRV